jgi:2-oxoglutarate ferredoxin oxidoreductase subunit beta
MAPVGCAVMMYQYLDIDICESPHGRTPEVAAGIKRARPDKLVYSYQGDGDLAAIGTAEIVHAAARGERITAIFVNNGIYGMTGGQMAPTTLLGQRTTSSPMGRDAGLMGYPIRITEMLAQLPGVTYAARGTIADASQIGKLKAMIKRACQVQIDGGGFAIVEALSNCPVGWGMTAQESLEHLKGPVVEAYPLGVIVDRGVPVASGSGAGASTPPALGAGEA